MNQQKNADYESDNVKDKNKTYLFYDIGVTTNNNNYWYYYPSGLLREVTDEYTSISSTTGATLLTSNSPYNTAWSKLRKFTPEITIEFEIIESTNTMFLIYYNNSNTFSNNNFKLSAKHWKIEIKTDGIYVNGIKKIDETIEGDVTFGFQNSNNNLNISLKYKGFMIYQNNG